MLDKIIIGIFHTPYSLEVKFGCIDGSVHTRDRSMFRQFAKVHERGPKPDLVCNMIHAGFDFPTPGQGEMCK